MKRRITLVLIGLLALSMISCNLISRFAGKAKKTAEAAVTSVVATMASLPTAVPDADAPKPDAPQPGAPETESDDEMTLVGTELTSGVRAKHYVYDFASADGTLKIHREIWVADQPGLPKVGVRAILRMESTQAQGAAVNETEATLYDINAPIEIKAPK